MDLLQVLRESQNALILGAYAFSIPATFLLLLTSLVRRSRRLRAPSRLSVKRLSLFAFLAATSLGIAAYLNYQFLIQSYREWLQSAYPPYNDGPAKLPLLARILRNLGIESLPEQQLKEQPKIGEVVVTPQLIREWLNSTQRPVEAVLVTNASPFAFWWTQQLVSVLPAWSLFLGWQGRRYRVSYVWAFMSLAQSVSPSLAISLFFAAVILSPINTPAKVSQSPVKVRRTNVDAMMGTATVEEHVALRERALYLDTSHISESPLVAWTLYLGTLAALAGFAAVPTFIGSDYFLYSLALPNLLLFLPTFIPTAAPDNLWKTYKHLFLFILAVQTSATVAVLAGVSFDGSVEAASAYVSSATGRLLGLAQYIYRTGPLHCAGVRESGLRYLMPRNSSLTDVTLAYVDHVILSLNTYGAYFYTKASQHVQRFAAQLVKEPVIFLVWLQHASAIFRTATDKLIEALLSHPLITAQGADAALCWISITSWVVTSSAFDDELAEESIEPALEAHETLKGLNGLNGHPGIPVRGSWFESHIG